VCSWLPRNPVLKKKTSTKQELPLFSNFQEFAHAVAALAKK
jgi:hypothetical protein